MITKIKYTATLSNGHVVTRNSDRAYTHFWHVSGKGETKGFSGSDAGFAGSLDLARKAIATTEARFRKHGGADVQFATEIVEVKAE